MSRYIVCEFWSSFGLRGKVQQRHQGPCWLLRLALRRQSPFALRIKDLSDTLFLRAHRAIEARTAKRTRPIPAMSTSQDGGISRRGMGSGGSVWPAGSLRLWNKGM